MKNLFLLTMFLSLLTLVSCSEKELIEEANKIPEGWTLQEEVIIIDGERYELEVIGNPETDEIEFLNAPSEIKDFFMEYEETLIPNVIIGDEKPTIFYYKDTEDFEANVKFFDSREEQEPVNRNLTVPGQIEI